MLDPFDNYDYIPSNKPPYKLNFFYGTLSGSSRSTTTISRRNNMRCARENNSMGGSAANDQRVPRVPCPRERGHGAPSEKHAHASVGMAPVRRLTLKPHEKRPRAFLHPSSFILHPFRPAVTLIELLVVITIILMLLFVVARRLRPAIDSRRVREAARAVNVYLSSAGTRRWRTVGPAG